MNQDPTRWLIAMTMQRGWQNRMGSASRHRKKPAVAEPERPAADFDALLPYVEIDLAEMISRTANERFVTY